MGGFNPVVAAKRGIIDTSRIIQTHIDEQNGPPPPKPPPIAPDLTDAAVKAARAGQLNQLLSARGRRSTFLTLPPVDLGSPFPSLNSSPPPVGGKTFLGQ